MSGSVTVFKKKRNNKEITKSTAERGNGNKTKEQERTRTAKENVTTPMGKE